MISKKELKELAELAHFMLTPEEESALQKDISNILEYVGQLRRIKIEVPTEASGVSAVSVPEGEGGKLVLYNAMRKDTPRAASDPLAGKEESLRAAFPQREGGFNMVRKIIEKDVE